MKEDYVDALAYLQKGIVISSKIDAKKLLMESYFQLTNVYEKMSDYKNAYKYHKIYSQIKDSLFNERSMKKNVEIQTKYETEKKEKEIQIQALKISEQALLLNNNKKLNFIIIILFLLLVIIGWAIFLRYRIKQQTLLKSEMLKQSELRTNAIIQTQEQERKRIAQDLHDGIGHKLTAIKINFEKLTKNIPFSKQEIIFEQTEHLLNETHKEVRTLAHTMMPKALQEKEFLAAISDLVEQTLANSLLKYSIKNEISIELSSSIQLCVYRVLQELLNNIIKHAQATEIAIQIFKNKDTLIMMVEDNGIGFQMNSITDGIGLRNIEGRVAALKGIFLIESFPTKGTIATVRIKL